MSKSLAHELAAFVAENPSNPGPKCAACLLPEDVRAAVEAEAAKGTTRSVVAKWLRMKGYKVSDYVLRNHVANHGK